ncbi:MAG: hypothetical protein IT204_02985 [Fimbriimonadaceae bacterium]|nr:hypothetical protein [Fimbriimonadaceae bacterium]
MRRLLLLTCCVSAVWAAPDPAAVKQTMDRATDYFTQHVATQGGYLWWYAADFSARAGEETATASQIWVQEPGTPAVGLALLRASEVTADDRYLRAAHQVGRALVWGQLESGGWDYLIDFDPTASKRWWYRRDVLAGDTARGNRRNTSTLDDDTTQLALRFLMTLDGRLQPADPAIHDAVVYALEHLLAAQYPNGAFAQRFDQPADPATPVLPARYPESWSRTFPKLNYASYYTFNDETLRDCIATLLLAHRLYGQAKYRAAALRAGDFILLAQMPEPQPVWAQQYNHQMEPAWARKFEPPSVTGGESAGVLRMLVDLWVETGDRKYLAPLPAALRWYRESRLPDGTWARFYELHTNRPLYFVKDTYELTYSDADLPTHYSFKSDYASSTIASVERTIAKEHAAVVAERTKQRSAAEWRTQRDKLAAEITPWLTSLDDAGRWVEGGKIQVGTYNRRLLRLADYLDAVRQAGG